MRLRHLAATLATLLVVGGANAAPAWSAADDAIESSAAADAAPADLLQRLDGGQPTTITLLGDSTGDAEDEWFSSLSVWLAGRHPAYRTTYQLWDDRGQAYGTETVLGGAVGGPALKIYNGSVAGKTAAYALDDDHFDELTGHVSHLYVINYGHNERDATTYPDYAVLTGRLHAKHPAAGIVPVLQNPESTANAVAHAERIQTVRTLAGENRWPVIDAYNAFRADPRPLSDLLIDGVHPKPAGHALWLAAAQRVFLDQSAQGDWTDCPTGTPATGGYICLWDNTNYDDGRLQRTYETLRRTTTDGVDGCWNLTSSAFSSGLWAYDSASSWALRKNPDSSIRYRVQIFEWINCNTEGNYRTYVVDQDFAAADLRTIGWNNTAASIRVTIAP